MPNNKVNVHSNNAQHNPRIGLYHYNMFFADYGSPIYLNQYKAEYLFVFIYWIYISFTVAFDTYPAQNVVTDNISYDRRPIYAIYWAPTYLYAALQVFSISGFLDGNRRYYIYLYGILVFLWHLAYFIIFWAAPSVLLPDNLTIMQSSAAYYWTELLLNMIMITIQCGNSQATLNYPGVIEEYTNKVNSDIAGYFAVENVDDIPHK
ncbi:hypothetical protein pb186bvf_012954 [Paramecium bursaria]